MVKRKISKLFPATLFGYLTALSTAFVLSSALQAENPRDPQKNSSNLQESISFDPLLDQIDLKLELLETNRLLTQQIKEEQKNKKILVDENEAEKAANQKLKEKIKILTIAYAHLNKEKLSLQNQLSEANNNKNEQSSLIAELQQGIVELQQKSSIYQNDLKSIDFVTRKHRQERGEILALLGYTHDLLGMYQALYTQREWRLEQISSILHNAGYAINSLTDNLKHLEDALIDSKSTP